MTSCTYLALASLCHVDDGLLLRASDFADFEISLIRQLVQWNTMKYSIYHLSVACKCGGSKRIDWIALKMLISSAEPSRLSNSVRGSRVILLWAWSLDGNAELLTNMTDSGRIWLTLGRYDWHSAGRRRCAAGRIATGSDGYVEMTLQHKLLPKISCMTLYVLSAVNGASDF